MAAVDKMIENSSRRLTFRQKFWLFGVGLLVLLMVVLLALLVFLPKPLNPTEQKLVGRWEVVGDEEFLIEFQREFVDSGRSASEWEISAALWQVNESTLTIEPVATNGRWARLYSRLGLSSHRVTYEIDFLSQDGVQLKNSLSGELLQLSRRK